MVYDQNSTAMETAGGIGFRVLHEGLLSVNMLKLLALATMTVDHIGVIFFPEIDAFRIVGRLSFPIFAYMIAEGCRYTHNKLRYFRSIFLLGLLCQIVFFAAEQSLYQCVLITFSLSIPVLYALHRAMVQALAWWIPAAAILAVWLLCEMVPLWIPESGFQIDYGFWGVMLPVFISLSENRYKRLGWISLGLLALSIAMGGVQWWSFLALLPLALYNGRRGEIPMKRLFYLYYPLHLAVLRLIHILL
ncbi:MAG: TraX family protein [Eubacteriales bacterium]|nr:TraX family protein [Eubacteriales bacterium]